MGVLAYYYFAGSIFTIQELLPFIIGVLALIGIIIGLFVFFVTGVARKISTHNSKKRIGLGASITVGFIILIVIILLVFVIPTKIKDSNYIKKQDRCALLAGFKSRAYVEDPNVQNLGEKQEVYSRCLR